MPESDFAREVRQVKEHLTQKLSSELVEQIGLFLDDDTLWDPFEWEMLLALVE